MSWLFLKDKFFLFISLPLSWWKHLTNVLNECTNDPLMSWLSAFTPRGKMGQMYLCKQPKFIYLRQTSIQYFSNDYCLLIVLKCFTNDFYCNQKNKIKTIYMKIESIEPIIWTGSKFVLNCGKNWVYTELRKRQPGGGQIVLLWISHSILTRRPGKDDV